MMTNEELQEAINNLLVHLERQHPEPIIVEHLDRLFKIQLIRASILYLQEEAE